MSTAEEQAFETLSDLSPEDVCRRAGVSFDRSRGLYVLTSFHQDIAISPQGRQISGGSRAGRYLLGELARYSKIPILRYLIAARDLPTSGNLIRPADLAGGQIYIKGTHVLPLGRLADTYGEDIQGFLKKGRELGGRPQPYGDASLTLFPFPRVPVVILLWKSDGEYPSRSDLLLDSTCELQLPPDIIWATTMMSLSMMMEPVSGGRGLA